MIEERTQPTGAYISYTTYFFVHFLLNNYSLWDPIYIRPDYFIFATHIRDSLSRLPFATPFATPIRDPISRPHSRPPFATHFRDSFLATHFHDYTRDSPSRLAFATTLATLVRDFRSCPQPRLAIFCRDFRRATPPLTDGLC